MYSLPFNSRKWDEESIYLNLTLFAQTISIVTNKNNEQKACNSKKKVRITK